MAVDAAPRDDFKQKLILSIIDKLVFGLLIVLAGFVLNLVLENHRADQALKSEIARLRVEKVAVIWQALDGHQRAVVALGQLDVRRSRQLATFPFAGEQVARRRERQWAVLRREQAKLISLVDTNRFWIGERLYPTYRNYAARQMDLLLAYQDVQFGMLKAAQLEDLRASSSSIRLTIRRQAKRIAAAYESGMRTVRERRRELNESRTDVFSAMEQLS